MRNRKLSTYGSFEFYLLYETPLTEDTCHIRGLTCEDGPVNQTLRSFDIGRERYCCFL